MITIFENIFTKERPYYIAIEKALNRVRIGKSKELIEKIRKEKDKDKRNDLKRYLPSVCFSGEFSKRIDSAIEKHSGFICLDFDGVKDLEGLKKRLTQNPYTYACFVSPSGNGLKVICKIIPEPATHEGCFLGLSQEYNEPSLDLKAKNIGRVCYESYDPEIYINHASLCYNTPVEKEEFSRIENPPTIPLTDTVRIFERLVNGLNKSTNYSEGNRNNYLYQLAADCCKFGISKTETARSIKTGFDLPENEIDQLIESAYSRTDFNSKYFEDREAIKTAQQLLTDPTKKKAEIPAMLQQVYTLTTEQAETITEQADKSIKNKIETFWSVYYNTDKGKVEKIGFVRRKFLNWLSMQGVGRYYYSDKQWSLVRIVNNRVREIDTAELKSIVFKYIEGLPKNFDMITQDQLFEFMAKGVNNYFSSAFIELIMPIDISFNRDGPRECWFYFENVAIKTTPEGIHETEYKNLPGCIWESQIIDHEFKPYRGDADLYDPWYLNDYSRFLFNAMGKDGSQFTAIETIIGYLLHSFKDDTKSPAIILMDEIISEDPNGGTGKGLFIKGIKHLKNIVTIDGKNFKFDKSFAFQRVSLDTQIIAFEDVVKRFDFERLFSVITEGIQVEKKNKDEFHLPFEDSPKVIITTNYTIDGDGGSNDRRKEEIEFTQHYNTKHTPEHDFGRILFKQWNNEEWQKFLHFMLNCSMQYLKKGIIKPKTKNLNLKKLNTQTAPEFIEWIAVNITMDEEYERKTMLSMFKTQYPDFEHKLKSRTFNNWVFKYAQYMDLELVERRAGNDFYYKLIKR